MPDIIQVTKLAEVSEIFEASEADGHYALAPTHYWRDTNERVSGYFSFGIVPVCHFWMRRDAKPRDSHRVIKACDALAAQRYQQHVAMIACKRESPFYNLIESHFGMKPIVTDTTLFGKHYPKA